MTQLTQISDKVDDGTFILMDATNQTIIIHPDESTYQEFKQSYNNEQLAKQKLAKFIGKPALLKDGSRMNISVNIGNEKDCSIALNNGVRDIGLFRSEYLYMNAIDFPTEDALYQQYQKMLDGFTGHIVIRTLDIGGDKSVDYFNIPKEDNPYLGYRAIRYCLDHEEVFKTQLKAILRLTPTKDISIMVPMITAYDEVIAFKRLLKEAKQELTKENLPFKPQTSIGIMIETPASVLISDILAKEVDFFSIGTNDLLQYTMAADRNNSLVEKNYSPYSQAFLRMLDLTIKNANQAGIQVSVCGEFASHTENLPLLIDLGIQHISVQANAVLEIKAFLSQLSKEDCRTIYQSIENKKSETSIQCQITR